VAWITAVGEALADTWPPAFEAVTTTAIVPPTSAEASVYVVDVAPAIELQLVPPESQRCHW
jgi:hypothetical protein